MAGPRTGNEFTRLVALRDIGERPVTRQIEAKPQEREALARRFGLLSLGSLSADLTLSWRSGEVIVEGELRAEAVQRCVVSLAEVPARVQSGFTLVFREQADAGARPEEEVDPEIEEEMPEPIGPEGIDLGEAVAQQLALALDPYPRHPDAELERTEWGKSPAEDAADSGAKNPFDVLKSLKRDG